MLTILNTLLIQALVQMPESIIKPLQDQGTEALDAFGQDFKSGRLGHFSFLFPIHPSHGLPGPRPSVLAGFALVDLVAFRQLAETGLVVSPVLCRTRLATDRFAHFRLNSPVGTDTPSSLQ